MAEGRIKEVYIEKCVLQSLNHPSIVKFYSSFKNHNKLYLLVEYCPQGSLQTFLTKNKKLTNPLIKHFAAEMIQSLEYLRQMQIVHRDLKPGNIVLDSKLHLKLIDFATCKIFNKEIAAKASHIKSKMNLGKSMGLDDNDIQQESQRLYSLVGTEEYIAPETINDNDLSYSCDLWSLGVIIFQMLCGSTPFKGRTIIETYHNIQHNTEIKFKDNVDPQAKDLVERLLRKEP